MEGRCCFVFSQFVYFLRGGSCVCVWFAFMIFSLRGPPRTCVVVVVVVVSSR